MNNLKQYLNKYTYLVLGLIILIITTIFVIIPNFQTEEFSQDVIDDIIDGVTTTSITISSNDTQTDKDKVELEKENLEISEEQVNLITNNFNVFSAQKDITGFNTYLLIGSDERSG